MITRKTKVEGGIQIAEAVGVFKNLEKKIDFFYRKKLVLAIEIYKECLKNSLSNIPLKVNHSTAEWDILFGDTTEKFVASKSLNFSFDKKANCPTFVSSHNKFIDLKLSEEELKEWKSLDEVSTNVLVPSSEFFHSFNIQRVATDIEQELSLFQRIGRELKYRREVAEEKSSKFYKNELREQKVEELTSIDDTNIAEYSHELRNDKSFWFLSNKLYSSYSRVKVRLRETKVKKSSLERRDKSPEKLSADTKKRDTTIFLASAAKNFEDDPDDETLTDISSPRDEVSTNKSDIALEEDFKKGLENEISELKLEEKDEEVIDTFNSPVNQRIADQLLIPEKILLSYECLFIKGVDRKDSIFLIGEENIYIVAGYCFDEYGELIEVEEEVMASDKSKWVLSKKSLPNKVLSSTLSRKNSRSSRRSSDGVLSEEQSITEHKCRVIPISSIVEVHARRFLLKPNAFEIFTQNKKSYFVAFLIHQRDEAFRAVVSSFNNLGAGRFRVSKAPLPKNSLFFATRFLNPFNHHYNDSQMKPTLVLRDASELLKYLTPEWSRSSIFNYEYLQILNILSGRTFSDLSQYPVFPWILDGFDGRIIDRRLLEIYRDLSKPMGALTPEREAGALKNYIDTQEDIQGLPPYHHGSLYSSPGIIMYYMIRLMPFSLYAANLQGGRFDYADRLFSSYNETFLMAKTLDYKELLGEFYQTPEFLLNMNEFNFGQTQSQTTVSSVSLPQWSKFDPRFFVLMLRKILEGDYVSQNIHNWIDLIFGKKQRGKPAIDAVNLFPILGYENSVDLEKVDYIEGILVQISEFGQIPKKLFSSAHTSKKKNGKSMALFSSLENLKNAKFSIEFETKRKTNQPMKIAGVLINKEQAKSSAFIGNGLSSFGKIASARLLGDATSTSELALFTEGSFIRGPEYHSVILWKNFFDLLIIQNPFKESNSTKIYSTNVKNLETLVVDQTGDLIVAGDTFGNLRLFEFVEANTKKNSAMNKSQSKQSQQSKSFTSHIASEYQFSMKKIDKTQNKAESCINSSILRNDGYFEPVNVIPSLAISKPKEKIREKELLEIVGAYPIPRKVESLKISSMKKKPIKKPVLTEKRQIYSAHSKKITAISFERGFDLLVTGDVQGVIKIWDLNKMTLENSILPLHYRDFDLFTEVLNFNLKERFLNVKKEEVEREKIKAISINPDNGDFVVVTRNYLSLYSVNGVLIAIYNRAQTEMAHFTTVIIASVNSHFHSN